MSFKVWIVVGAVAALVLGGLVWQAADGRYFTDDRYLIWNIDQEFEDGSTSERYLIWNPDGHVFEFEPAGIIYGDKNQYTHPETYNGTLSHIGKFTVIEWKLPKYEDVVLDPELEPGGYYDLVLSVTADGEKLHQVGGGYSTVAELTPDRVWLDYYIHQEAMNDAHQKEINELRYDVEKLQKKVNLILEEANKHTENEE